MDDFLQLVSAPKDILGKDLLLLHWAGVTEKVTLRSMEEAAEALRNGWTRYRVEPPT